MVTRLAPARAARVALGIVLPLVVGWLSGHMRYGAFAALGALPAAFSSFQGETRTRVAAVVLASIGMALSTFVGGTMAAASPWLLVPVIAAWGYLTGLSVCLEPRWSIAILQWSVALLIAVGLPVGPSEAAVRAGLVLAGGLLQALLVAASWTMRPGSSERGALAASFDSLAAYARQVSQGDLGPPPHTAFPATAILADPNPLLQRSLRLMLVDLLNEAERVRVSLAALAVQALDRADAVDELRALMARSAVALDLVANLLRGLRDRHAPARHELDLRELDARVARMAVPQNVAWRWSGEALLGQLRAVAHTIGALDTTRARPAGASDAAGPTPLRWQSEFAWALAMLRANVGIRTEAGRHAVRLAVVAALAEAIVQATGEYQGRWAALTVFIVLKPDHASTFTRGLQRALGTLLGAAAGGALVDMAHRSQGAMVAAAGICIAVAFTVLDATYVVFALFLTMFIVVLLSMLGSPAEATAQARAVATFIGAALSLVAYAAWPTREAATAQEKFARLLEAHRDYATGLLGELAHPGRSGRAALRGLQATARRVRSDAEAAASRLADERAPRGGVSPEMARQLIAAVSRLAHAELALHALALSEPAATASRSAGGITGALVDEVGSALGSALGGAADAMRSLRTPDPLPAARPIHSRLVVDAALRDGPLVPLLDRVMDATHTIDGIVRERFRSVDGAPNR